MATARPGRPSSDNTAAESAAMDLCLKMLRAYIDALLFSMIPCATRPVIVQKYNGPGRAYDQLNPGIHDDALADDFCGSRLKTHFLQACGCSLAFGATD